MEVAPGAASAPQRGQCLRPWWTRHLATVVSPDLRGAPFRRGQRVLPADFSPAGRGGWGEAAQVENLLSAAHGGQLGAESKRPGLAEPCSCSARKLSTGAPGPHRRGPGRALSSRSGRMRKDKVTTLLTVDGRPPSPRRPADGLFSGDYDSPGKRRWASGLRTEPQGHRMG